MNKYFLILIIWFFTLGLIGCSPLSINFWTTKCYDENWNINKEPTKDPNWNIVNCFDKNGIAQWYWIYENHISWYSEAYIVDWKYTWPFTDYYENWEKFREWTYSWWELIWHIVVYYENWNTKSDFNTNNYKYYWDNIDYYENWQIESIMHYNDEWCLVWEHVAYYENWNVKVKWNYTDECWLHHSLFSKGTMTWDWYRYYENGQLESIEHYIYWQPSWEVIHYYDNGKIEEIVNYAVEWNELSFIAWRNWDYISYYENWNIKEKWKYAYWEKIGDWYEYDENWRLTGDRMPYSKKATEEARNYFNVEGTPTFAIINTKTNNYKVLNGAYPLETFKEAINDLKNWDAKSTFEWNAGTLGQEQINEILDWVYYMVWNKNSEIIIIEYFDLLDTYSKQFYNWDILKTLINNYNIAIIMKNTPNNNHFEMSWLWAKGSDCAWEIWWSNAYYKYIDKAIKEEEFNEDNIISIAKELSLDIDKFSECYWH